MIKNLHYNKRILILTFLSVALIVGIVLILLKEQSKTYTNSTTGTGTPKASQRLFSSKSLDFSVELPKGFEVEEKFTTVVLKSSDGEILISRAGSNFDNIDDYLADLTVRNKLRFREKKKLTINDLEAIRGKFTEEGREEIIFFIYVEDRVFSISTTSNPLFDDLDQIALSFHYTP